MTCPSHIDFCVNCLWKCLWMHLQQLSPTFYLFTPLAVILYISMISRYLPLSLSLSLSISLFLFLCLSLPRIYTLLISLAKNAFPVKCKKEMMWCSRALTCNQSLPPYSYLCYFTARHTAHWPPPDPRPQSPSAVLGWGFFFCSLHSSIYERYPVLPGQPLRLWRQSQRKRVY